MASGGTDYGKLLKNTWEAIIQKDNLIVLLIGAVVMALASTVTVGILAGPLVLGYASACIKIGRGETVAIDELWKGFERLVPAIVTSLILGIGVVVGLVLCVVPGIAVALLGSMTFHVMVDDDSISGMDAIKKSAELVKANLTDVIVVWLVGGLINAVLSVSVVGIVGGIAFAALMSGFLYDEIKSRSPAGGGSAL